MVYFRSVLDDSWEFENENRGSAEEHSGFGLGGGGLLLGVRIDLFPLAACYKT